MAEALPEPTTDGALDGGQRLQVVDTLLDVLAGAYCHLPHKRAAYAVDPIQGLRLLRRRCVEMGDEEFHRAVTALVTSLRDGHTRYRGPRALHGRVAVLPFLVEAYTEDGTEHFVVSKVSGRVPEVDERSFVPGVRLLTWNAVPFARAVDLHAERETGSHPDARRLRGLQSLTQRALDHVPPPDELWVQLGYQALDGSMREVRIPWRTIDLPPARSADIASGAAMRLARDPAAEAVRRAKADLFGPTARRSETRSAVLAESFGDVVRATTVETPRGRIGHLRMWSFDVADDDAFLAEVARLLTEMPAAGLVVDLRGNPGGLIWAAERMLQLFTGRRPIVPTRFELLASPLTLAMARSPFNRFELGGWAASLEDAVVTGEPYSRPLPLTDPEWCNDTARAYDGPVVAVVDAATYSAGDLFAAGWVDNGVGPLVSVGRASGGGGANVWSYLQLCDAVAGSEMSLPRLPEGVDLTISVRRAIRSGAADGLLLEDVGVDGIPYAMTQRDLLEGNSDLLAFCAEQL